MYETFKPRIMAARNKLEKLENIAAPTIPKYDLIVESSTASGGAISGVVEGNSPVGSPFKVIESNRVGFANVAAGGLSISDTVSMLVQFDPDNNSGGSASWVALVVAITGDGNGAATQAGSEHSTNWDSYPTLGTNPTTLNWSTDPTEDGINPIPEQEAGMLAYSAAFPAGGVYTPSAGSLISQINDDLSLAVSYVSDIPANTYTEPGGSWSSSKNFIVGNYQFLKTVGGITTTLIGSGSGTITFSPSTPEILTVTISTNVIANSVVYVIPVFYFATANIQFNVPGIPGVIGYTDNRGNFYNQF